MTVRLLHTSDWHLGQAFHDVDRLAEQGAFLDWLVERCAAERVHALLVAGDVFDVANPPATAVARFARFLVALWSRLPEVRVIIIGGNHDSAHRLEATGPFLDALGRLHVLGALPRRDGAVELDRVLLHVPGDGAESALVVAVPFLRAADLRAEELDADDGAPVRRIHAELLAAARERRRAGEPIVLMGHLTVAGGIGTSERELVGGVAAVPADAFPGDVAYAALGHLHRPQSIGERIRYPGAPLPLSFDEAGYPQEVLLVELAGGVATARAIVVPRARALLRLPAVDFAPLPEILAALRALPARGDEPEETLPLVEVHVHLPSPEPTLRRQLDEALEGRAGRLVGWRVRAGGDGAALGDARAGDALTDLDPLEVFRRRWSSRSSEPLPAELLAAYGELLEEVRGVAPAAPVASAAGAAP